MQPDIRQDFRQASQNGTAPPKIIISPRPDEARDKALEDTFPASDPPGSNLFTK